MTKPIVHKTLPPGWLGGFEKTVACKKCGESPRLLFSSCCVKLKCCGVEVSRPRRDVPGCQREWAKQQIEIHIG